MHCSKSEQLFEGRIEGTLAPRDRQQLDVHLNDCRRCASVFEELRVIDALLLTPRKVEPAPNFTFKAMAEIRTLPAPRPVRAPWPPWALFAMYLVLSWIAIGAWFAVGRPDGPASLALAGSFLQHLAGAMQGIGRAIGSTGIAGVVTLVLIADLVLASAALYAGIVLRPRIIARLARGEGA